MSAVPGTSAQPATTADELELARREIRALRTQLKELAWERDLAAKRLTSERELSERYRQQLHILRNSSSWRVTRPLRLVRRKTLGRGEF